MPFPDTPAERYKENPLETVICQVRFPDILKIASESPAQFQDAIRDRYPLYSEKSITDELLAGARLPQRTAELLNSLPIQPPQGRREYRFTSPDEQRVISLGRDFLAFADDDYKRWSLFRPEMQLAEEALRHWYSPAFYSRIGLRYRDVLDKDKLGLQGVPWGELLNPSFLGVLADHDIADEVEDIQTQALVSLPEVPGGHVRIRHSLGQSPDEQRQVYVIDCDFFTGRTEINDTFGILDNFNKLGARLFRWVATQRLRDALEIIVDG